LIAEFDVSVDVREDLARSLDTERQLGRLAGDAVELVLVCGAECIEFADLGVHPDLLHDERVAGGLKITGDGRKAALDLRLVGLAEDPEHDTKLKRAPNIGRRLKTHRPSFRAAV
jgi:hypothetical protein